MAPPSEGSGRGDQRRCDDGCGLQGCGSGSWKTPDVEAMWNESRRRRVMRIRMLRMMWPSSDRPDVGRIGSYLDGLWGEGLWATHFRIAFFLIPCLLLWSPYGTTKTRVFFFWFFFSRLCVCLIYPGKTHILHTHLLRVTLN